MGNYWFDVSEFRIYLGMPGFMGIPRYFVEQGMLGYFNNLLISFWYAGPWMEAFQNFKDFAGDLLPTMNIMIDSGAFSAAYSKNARTITKENYAHFLNKFPVEEFGSVVAINLDVIFASTEKKSAAEWDAAAKQSFENWLWLREHVETMEVLPVLHRGESCDLWYKILEKDISWLASGGLVGETREVRRRELHRIFSFCQENGFKGKVHGLGVTDSILVREFPFFSVDSVTYFKGTGFGNVSIFDEEIGGIRVIYVSELQPGTSLSEATKRWILDRTRVDFVTTWEDLKNYWNRQAVSLVNFKAFEEFVRKERQTTRKEQLPFQPTIDLLLEKENE